MFVTQHYLYYMNEDGHAVILIRYETQPNGQVISEWISHLFITDYNPPLLLSLKEATAVLHQEEGLNFEIQIGDWVGIKRCQQNLHKVEPKENPLS